MGALAVASPPGAANTDADIEGVLAILADNAAVAMENARLYELEKESVRRLRELDTMKTDFLATVQHELRTPLTAILGLSDLIEMCWEVWEDPPKLDALRDIQVAARNLDGIVETIIDFSVGDGEELALTLSEVPLEGVVLAALSVVGERHKGGLPVPAEVEVEPGLTLHADPDRLGQVLRALIDNAVKFSDGRGRVLIRGRRVDAGNGSRSRSSTRASGFPLTTSLTSSSVSSRWTTPPPGGSAGPGWGSRSSSRVVTAHGATVEVESGVGSGTRVSLRWPAPGAVAAGAAGKRTGGVPRAGTMTVVALGGALAVPCTRNPL